MNRRLVDFSPRAPHAKNLRVPARTGTRACLVRVVVSMWLTALLSACATIKPQADIAGWRSVAGVDPASTEHFRVAGRLAVSDGRDGGSAGFLWTQQGEAYTFELRQPVSQRTWRLTGDARGAVLEGGEDGPVRGTSAENLLQEVLGWHVPVDALRRWVRGLADRGVLESSERDAQGRLTRLEQAGWRVEYRDWLDDGVWPTRVRADRPPYSVRLSIRDWAVADD